jgi:SAM-dependent methyltransferase
MLAGFTPRDGMIEFYSRINALVGANSIVFDLGAGRGAWYHEDTVPFRRNLRTFKGKVAEYIGADVDEVVLENPTTDRNVLIKDGIIPLPDQSVDLVFCDFVLEHIVDVDKFKAELDRIVKPGGYFCGRTPHKNCYFSLAARLVKNENHVRWLRKVQPKKKERDTFPTAYRLNTLGTVKRLFSGGWDDYSYIFTDRPAYYFGKKFIYDGMSMLHRIAPPFFTGCLFVFMVKRGKPQTTGSWAGDDHPHPDVKNAG